MDIADIRPNPIHQTGIPCNFQNFNLVQGNLLPIYISRHVFVVYTLYLGY